MANLTSVSELICWIPPTNCRTYSRCQRNGGCTTTVCAPTSSAASFARTSLIHGSVPQTRCVITRHGACSARIGTWWWSESRRRAATSCETGSVQTMTSTPS